MPGQPHIVDVKDFGPGGFKWITLRRLQYVDQEGRERVWEAAERRTSQGAVDAVAILAKVSSKNSPDKIILVSQFRPPQGNFVIEFPAGLIDKGESASQSAVRELREETGYSGNVTEESPIIYSDPGLTSSNFQMVTIEIDADAEANRNVNPQLEDGEFVETLLLPVAGLYMALLDLQKERHCDLDARLLLYAQGLHHAEQSSSARRSPAASSEAASQPTPSPQTTLAEPAPQPPASQPVAPSASNDSPVDSFQSDSTSPPPQPLSTAPGEANAEAGAKESHPQGSSGTSTAGLRALPARPGARSGAAGQSKAAGAGTSAAMDKKTPASSGNQVPTPGRAADTKATGQTREHAAGTSAAKWGIEPAPLTNGKRHVPSSDDSDFWKEGSEDTSKSDGWPMGMPSDGRTWLAAGWGAAAGTLAAVIVGVVVSSRRGGR
ncbi:hypothetical protein WJX84_005877 [Apatococcus fuscideae]|uniref:Nudix hydrolase domain-containing protein n=1 Tax=Apatococcus fuscideae TaxID=2026836 RepID=A0AAW1TKG0_9CHLO